MLEGRYHLFPFLDYQISRSLQLLNKEEKLKIIKYTIKLTGKPTLFHQIFTDLKPKDERMLLARCKEERQRIPKESCTEIY